jgi:hypothetical protein
MFIIAIVVKGFDREQILPIISLVALTFGFYTIQFIAGVRLIQKGRLKNKAKVHNKKLIILTVSTLVFSILMVIGVYRLNSHYDMIDITYLDQVVLKQIDNNNFAYIRSLDKTLRCSINEYFSLWSLKINSNLQKDNTSFKLEFVWNNFSPKKGKITKIIR